MAGTFLEIEGQPRKSIARTLRASYDDRNAIVHGRRLSVTDPEAHVLSVEGAVRGGLTKILSEAELVTACNDPTSREPYLVPLAK